jgi:hypothetical protein
MQDESISERISNSILKIKQNESLVTHFERIAKEVTKDYDKNNRKGRKPDSYRVTDLINPMQAYMDIKNPDLDDPKELKELFAYGNFVEQRVISLLKKDKENKFASNQGSVNGTVIGMSEVNGLIDARIGDSIVEIKSSEEDIASKEELITEHPQDLEQLLLYSLFASREGYYHYLIYVVGKHPSVHFRIFRVKITNKSKLVESFKNRLVGLKASLNNGKPTGLGKCRYFSKFCKFRKSGLCECQSEKELDISFISKSTYITLLDDQDPFCQKFSSYGVSLSIRFWDLFQPRKWLLKQKNPFYYEYFEEDDYYKLRKYLEDKIMGSDLGVKQHWSRNKFINDTFLTYKGKPLLVRYPKGNSLDKLNESYRAQLGLIALSEGEDRGYIFSYYKDQEVGKLYEVVFSRKEDDDRVLDSEIKQMVDIYFNASNYSVLPVCPDFIQKNCGDGCYCKSI